jgi:hypothetical protein
MTLRALAVMTISECLLAISAVGRLTGGQLWGRFANAEF